MGGSSEPENRLGRPTRRSPWIRQGLHRARQGMSQQTPRGDRLLVSVLRQRAVVSRHGEMRHLRQGQPNCARALFERALSRTGRQGSNERGHIRAASSAPWHRSLVPSLSYRREGGHVLPPRDHLGPRTCCRCVTKFGVRHMAATSTRPQAHRTGRVPTQWPPRSDRRSARPFRLHRRPALLTEGICEVDQAMSSLNSSSTEDNVQQTRTGRGRGMASTYLLAA